MSFKLVRFCIYIE